MCLQPPRPLPPAAGEVGSSGIAGQAQADRIAQAEAAMVDMQRVVWREENRRQLAL